MNSSIILTQTEYEDLLKEIAFLKDRIATLTALRDDLIYHVCPALRLEYEEKIASLERELFAAQLYLREKQRTFRSTGRRIPAGISMTVRTVVPGILAVEEKRTELRTQIDQTRERNRQLEEYIKELSKCIRTCRQAGCYKRL